MKVLTALAICVVGLALVVGAAKPTRKQHLPRKPASGHSGETPSAQKTNYEEGIRNLLLPFCKNDDTCTVLVYFAATLCSTPSISTTCQSDCKFLLRYLWDVNFIKNKPEVGQLQEFVPDHCAPGYADSEQSSPISYNDNDDEDEDDQMSPFVHEGKTHNMYHLGYDYDDEEEEIERAVAELKVVVQDNGTVTCQAPVPRGPTLKPGQIHKRPCSDEFPFQIGNIVGVCLESGYLYYSNYQCDVDFDLWETAADAYKTKMDTMLSAKDIDAKKALDGGATLLKGVADFLSKDKVKDFLPIAGKIASVLGPIGIAFQAIAFFLPASDPKHDEIMAAFKRLEQQTTEIKNAIDRLPNIFKKELFDARIEQMVTNLVYLEGDIELFSTQNTEAFRNKVEKSCANFPGDKFITDVTQIFISKSPDYISELYGYDHEEFSAILAKPILVYSMRATQVAMKCLGLDKKTTQNDTQFFSKKLEERVKVLYGKVNYIDEDFIPNHAMANWIDTDMTEFMEKHKGQDNQQLSSALYGYLNKKYNFYNFAVAVYNKVSSSETAARAYKCFKCVGKQYSGMYFTDKQYDKSVQIMYSKTYIPDIESKVKEIYEYAGRKNLQYYVDYLTKGTIRNALACRFGEGLRSHMNVGGAARFYNIQSVSTLITY